MVEKNKENLKTLIECIGLDIDVYEYIKDLEKSRDEVLSRKGFRKEVISLIKKKEMCVCELSNIFNLTQPSISHHVKILEQAGLIKGIKNGKFIHYQINS